MRLTRRGPLWCLSPFSAQVQAISKVLPGVTWDRDARGYMAYGDAMGVVLATLKARGERCPVGDDFDVSICEPVVPIAEKKLREYQREGVRFLLGRGKEGCILADDMGLGKTCQALTAARALNSRTLVVCPNHVKGVWEAEAKKWWPKAGAGIFFPSGIKDPRPVPPGTLLTVVHYDILAAHVKPIRDWSPRWNFFDEGHCLQGEKSQRSQAARAVCSGVELRSALTGTPMLNRPRDMWNLADIISPGRFGGFFGFGLRYCDAHKESVTPTKTVWKFDGRSHEDELRNRLRHFMLRRLKSDVALQLPPKTRQIVNVDVGATHRKIPAGSVSAVAIRRWLDAVADEKMGPGRDVILSHLEGGHKVVVFCYRRSVAEWMFSQAKAAGFPAELIHGGVNVTRRGAAVARAKGVEGAGLLVATIDSSSTGIDFSFADVGVFLELTYEPHELLQAEARLHRFGQLNPTLIQYLIARGTSDELVADIVIKKLDAFDAVVGGTGEKLGEDLRGKTEDVLAELSEAVAQWQLG